MSGVTPARAARDQAKARALEEQIKGEKYLEFRLACDEGDATACFSLGEWFAVVKSDYDTAARLYRENCMQRKHGSSCYNLGRLHANGRGVAKSADATVDMFKRGCDGDGRAGSRNGNADACYYGAAMLLAGKHVAADPTRAAAMLRRGCHELTGGALSCAKLGSMLLLGDAATGTERDPAAAAPLLKMACVDGRHAPSCRNLAVMYHKGDGVPRDEAEAQRRMEDAKQLAQQEGMLRGGGSAVQGGRKRDPFAHLRGKAGASGGAGGGADL